MVSVGLLFRNGEIGWTANFLVCRRDYRGDLGGERGKEGHKWGQVLDWMDRRIGCGGLDWFSLSHPPFFLSRPSFLWCPNRGKREIFLSKKEKRKRNFSLVAILLELPWTRGLVSLRSLGGEMSRSESA